MRWKWTSVVAVILCATATFGADGGVTLVRDGRATSVIVVADRPTSAARRAAKVAAEETDAISRVAPARKDDKAAKGEKPASALSRHRRPILLAVGAVLLAIMSYPLVSTLVTGDEAPVVVEQTAGNTNETGGGKPVDLLLGQNSIQ